MPENIDYHYDDDNDVSESEDSNKSSESSETSSLDESSEDMPRLRRSRQRSGAQSAASTSSASNNSNISSRNSSDTEEYDIDETSSTSNSNPPVIEIPDTQSEEPIGVVDEVEDDDIIMVPQYIETIDLCTQILTPQPFRHPVAPNEVIEIQDSPATQVQNHTGPSHVPRSRSARHSPYPVPKRTRIELDESVDEPTQSVKISCPICLESIIGRQPVSTICGHLFCKNCIQLALKSVKKCPMCKRTLKAGNFHDIFLG